MYDWGACKVGKDQISAISVPAKERELQERGRFHGRQYRKYSDGTLKAATSGGWKEFSNFDDFCNYHWKNHYETQSKTQASRPGWLTRIFGAPSHKIHGRKPRN